MRTLSIVFLLSMLPLVACNTPSRPHPKVESGPSSTFNDLNQPPPVDTNGRINRY
jgi:hypothetical protein